MKSAAPFGAQLKTLREAAAFTQEELATIAGLSVHAVSALERGQRRRPHVETVRALAAALDLTGQTRDLLFASARAPVVAAAVDELRSTPLPHALTTFRGRERDVLTLRAWLASPDVRLVTLLGPGGVGKTRLAQELARGLAAEGSVRVLFESLACIREPGLAACAIAEALGLADLSGSDLPRRASAACGNQPTLLVLDNFEQVVGAAPLIADLLASVPVLRLLITSRAALRVRGEREYVVNPLDLAAGAEAMSPADLARVAAVRLFVERVRDVQPDFCLTPANAPVVAAICRRLDGLPLALELAAPWLKVLTPEDLLRRLERDPLLSAVSPRDRPERHHTMEATVAWSYHLLDAPAQRALRRLAALPGRFSIDAAAAVLASPGTAASAGEVLGALATLVDKSLLLRADSAVPDRPLYLMLETVRAYAARELAATNGLEESLDGVASYCTREASCAFDGLVGSAQADWLHRVHDDLENYRCVLAWLLARGRAAEAADIAWGLAFFWLIRGHAAEGLWWYDATLKQTALPPAAEAKVLTGVALLSFSQADLPRARSALARVLAPDRDASDVAAVVRAEAEDISGRIALGGDDLMAARGWFTRAIARFNAAALPWGAGNALIGLSGVAIETGDLRQAERLLDEATSLVRHAGPWFLARALFVRAILAVGRGRPVEALVLVRQSLTRIRDLQDKYAFVHAAVPLAAAAALTGDDRWAARVLGAQSLVAERTGARIVIKTAFDLGERVTREVRERLGLDRWARFYAAGRETSIDALLKDIDTALEAGGRIDSGAPAQISAAP